MHGLGNPRRLRLHIDSVPEVDDEHRFTLVQFGLQLVGRDPGDSQVPQKPLPSHNLDGQVHGERPGQDEERAPAELLCQRVSDVDWAAP